MSQTPARYRLYGLSIRSDVPLPARRRLDDTGPVDLTVTRASARPIPDEPPDGRVLLDLEGDRHFYTGVVDDDGHHVLRFYGSCDIVVGPDLSTITIRPHTEVDPDFINVLLVGTLLAFVLTLRGHLVLHASAVQIGSDALAFVGASGMGKSTMATLVSADGAPLITDDVLRVDLDVDGPPRCHLGATEARIRKAADELASRFESPPDRRVTGDQRHALELPASMSDGLPLARIVIPAPNPDPAAEVRVSRLPGTDALLAMLSFPRLLGWRDPDVLARHVHQLGEVVDRVPVYVAELPWGPPFQPDVAARVLDQVGLAAPRG